MNIERLVLVFSALLFGMLSMSGEPEPKVPPRFEDYPALEVFNGKPALPHLVAPSQRLYRTRIRDGVEKGWGVNQDGVAQNKPGPNFAGNMIFIQWSCGAPCLMAVLVNAHTGEVYDPPLAGNGTLGLPVLVLGNSVGQNPQLEFHKSSRLLVLSATPDSARENARSYRYYFVWQSSRWSLVHKISLD